MNTRIDIDLSLLDAIEKWLAVALQNIHIAQWKDAEYACKQVLQIDENHADAHHLAGHVAGQMGNSSQALDHLVKAIAANPRHPQYRYNYAVSLGLLGRENEAAVQYQACLRQDPNHRDALWNYGEMLRLSEHFELAAQLLERFAANGGNYSALNHRLGVIYGALGQDEAANAHFLKELNVAPAQADPLTHWEYSLFLLSRERFTEGFAHYGRRFDSKGRNSVFCHDFELPMWHGQFTHGSTLLIHGEQGLGDEMMFASIVPEVLAKACEAKSRVILAVKPAVVRLFKTSFPGAIIIPHRVGGPAADISALGQVDWQVPIGDLPQLFRRNLQDFYASRKAYLFADQQRAAWYAKQLAALEAPQDATQNNSTKPKKLRVGLMWGSNPANVNAKFVRWSQQRSIPIQMFERMAKLVPEVEFVSLQNAERGYEAGLAPSLDILDLSHLQTDFLETASLIANLDLVISVDTSVSHLAGAMGKETWVPLMHRSDWRHRNKREHSYWYSNTRYFHQSKEGDWTPVLETMTQALAEYVNKKNMGVRPKLPASVSSKGLDERTEPRNDDLSKAVELLAQRDFEKARPYFESALAASPNDPRVKWEYAMQLLTEGKWARGWEFHEARLDIFGAQGLNMCPLPWPKWCGESLSGRTIVVHGEQGVGDEIMYLSMLPELLETKAKIVLACVPSLVEIFQYSFPTMTVVPHPRGSSQNWVKSLPFWTNAHVVGSVDFQIPIGSLGKFLRRRDQDFPRQAYLRADPARVAKLAARLKEKTLQKLVPTSTTPLRIGLAWCGSLGDANARARSIQLKEMKVLIDVGKSRGWQFISLQSRQYAMQIAEEPSFDLVDMSEDTDDFADLAALMANLDLVISVDTSYAHLAAALGLSTWRMVTRTCDWRWGWGREDSVWYPNDRLFRQQTDGNWDTVIQTIASELENVTGRIPI